MNNGWIKMYRQILDWKWYHDLPTRAVFQHLLLSANLEEKAWKDIVIKPGQLVTSLEKLSNEVGTSKQQSRRALKNLQTTHEITQSSTSTYTLITINNFFKYQSTTQSATNKQQTNNTVRNIETTTTKEVKKNKEITTGGFEEFIKTFNDLQGSSYRPTDGNRIKYQARLKNFTHEQVLFATKTMLSLPHYLGQNDRKWKASPEFILRNDEQIDKFINAKPKPQTEVRPVAASTIGAQLDQALEAEAQRVREFNRRKAEINGVSGLLSKVQVTSLSANE